MKKNSFLVVAFISMASISTFANAKKIFAFAEYAQLTYDEAKATYGSPSTNFKPDIAKIDEKLNSFVIGAGYKLSPQLSVFGGYGDFGTFTASQDKVSANTPGLSTAADYKFTYNSENTGFLGGAMLDISLGKSFNLTGMAGMVYTKEKISLKASPAAGSDLTLVNKELKEFRVFFGAGASYKMKNNMEVYGFWKRYTFDVADADAIGGGIKFSF